MLNDLQEWFFWDPTTVSSLVMAGMALVALIVFYVFVRKPRKHKEEEVLGDPFEEFLAEEFQVQSRKEPEFLKLPPEPTVDIFEEPTVVVTKHVVKKTAKKKASKKKASKKKASKKKAAKKKVD